MRKESKRATVDAAAQRNSTTRQYHRVSRHASRINDVLAELLFRLQEPSIGAAERKTTIEAIDGLIRLKIDAHFLRGGSL